MRKIITTGSDDRLIKLYNSNANFTEYSDTISKYLIFSCATLEYRASSGHVC